RVMLLDDEAEITSAGTVSVGDRLIRVLRIPSAPVDLQAIALGFLRCFDTAAGRLGEGLEQVSVVVEAVEDLLEPQLNDGRRIVELVPCAGRGDGRSETTAQGVGGDGRLRRRVLRPVDEHSVLP